MNAQQLIEKYQLEKHPEGGWYKETYRNARKINAADDQENNLVERNISTAIYFLLEKGSFSAFHRIKSDECWHFYVGGTLLIYVIHINGELEIVSLGADIEKGELFQYVVPANCWFASIPAPSTDFSFVGCTVAPGFDFADFELAVSTNLCNTYPQHKSTIQALCIQ